MLRIAEYNTKTGEKIDLKELEKFGFNIEENTEDEWDQLYCFDSGLMFDKDNKEIIVPLFDEGNPLNTLYDLIKADLVEKVEE